MISSKFGTFAAPVPLRSTLAPYMVTQLKNVVIGLNSHKTGTLHHISPEALQFDTLVAITALILFFQRFFELCHKSADRSKNFLWITTLRLTKRNLLRQE